MTLEKAHFQENLGLNQNTKEQLDKIKNDLKQKVDTLKQDGSFSDEDLNSLVDLLDDKTILSPTENELKEHLKKLENLQSQVDFLLALVEVGEEENGNLNSMSKEEQEALAAADSVDNTNEGEVKKIENNNDKNLVGSSNEKNNNSIENNDDNEISKNIDISEKILKEFEKKPLEMENINNIINILKENNINITTLTIFFEDIKEKVGINHENFLNSSEKIKFKGLNLDDKTKKFLLVYQKVNQNIWNLNYQTNVEKNEKSKKLYDRLMDANTAISYVKILSKNLNDNSDNQNNSSDKNLSNNLNNNSDNQNNSSDKNLSNNLNDNSNNQNNSSDKNLSNNLNDNSNNQNNSSDKNKNKNLNYIKYDPNLNKIDSNFNMILKENQNTINKNFIEKFLSTQLKNKKELLNFYQYIELRFPDKKNIINNIITNVLNNNKDLNEKFEKNQGENYDLYQQHKIIKQNEIIRNGQSNLDKKISKIGISTKQNLNGENNNDKEKIILINNFKEGLSNILKEEKIILKEGKIPKDINDYFDKNGYFDLSKFTKDLFKSVGGSGENSKKSEEKFIEIIEKINNLNLDEIKKNNNKIIEENIKNSNETIKEYLKNEFDNIPDKAKKYFKKNEKGKYQINKEEFFKGLISDKNFDTNDIDVSSLFAGVTDIKKDKVLKFLENIGITREYNKYLYLSSFKVLYYENELRLEKSKLGQNIPDKIDGKALYEHFSNGGTYESYVKKVQQEKENNQKNSEEKSKTQKNSTEIFENLSFGKYNLDISSSALKTDSGKNIPLNQEEINMIQKSREVAKNIINLYETLEKTGLKKIWKYKENIFKSVENTFNLQFDRNDGNYLDERETKILLNSILVSIGEKPVKTDIKIENFTNEIENRNGKQISGTETQVNNLGETAFEKKFIEKFVGRGDLVGFKQSEFENALKQK